MVTVSLELSIALIVIGVILWAVSRMGLPPGVATALYYIGIALLIIGVILLVVWIFLYSGLLMVAPLVSFIGA